MGTSYVYYLQCTLVDINSGGWKDTAITKWHNTKDWKDTKYFARLNTCKYVLSLLGTLYISWYQSQGLWKILQSLNDTVQEIEDTNSNVN